MEVPYFFTDENNDVVKVDTFDNAMNTIKLRYQKLQDKIEHLSQENQELKSGVFATNYVQEALANAEKIRNEYRLGFPMTEEEVQKAEKWMKEHDESDNFASNKQLSLPKVIEKIRNLITELNYDNNVISTSEVDLSDQYQIVINIKI